MPIHKNKSIIKSIITMSSSFSKEKSNVERCCANSTCDKAGVHLCAGCGEEIYCSKDCQKAHWQSHKVQCQNALRPKAAVSSSQSFDALSVKQLKNVMKAKAGTFDAIKRTKILEQLDHIIERPALIKFVSEHIQPAEVDKLLATPESSSKAQASRPSEPKKKKEVLPPVPSPDQMRQQATMMRKNPDLVRRSNAALANFSDAQICEYADQLEKAAKDPEMLKEIIKVSRLSTDDRDRLQKFQEGLSGSRPMDAAWVDLTVDTLRNRNEILKTLFHGRGAMFGGVTDEQIDSFLDMLARQEAWILKLLVQTMLYLGSLVKPVSELYQRLDKATLGLANYVLAAIAIFILYMFLRGVWWMMLLFYKLVFVGGKAASNAADATKAAATASSGLSGTKSSVLSSVASTLSTGIAAGAKAAVDAVSKAEAAVGGQATQNIKASLDEDF